MKAVQYTIRNIPLSVDRYYRKLAAVSGKSLNRVIVEELSQKAGTTQSNTPNQFIDSLSWLFDSGLDQATLDALDQMDAEQKLIGKREEAKLDEIAKL